MRIFRGQNYFAFDVTRELYPKVTDNEYLYELVEVGIEARFDGAMWKAKSKECTKDFLRDCSNFFERMTTGVGDTRADEANCHFSFEYDLEKEILHIDLEGPLRLKPHKKGVERISFDVKERDLKSFADYFKKQYEKYPWTMGPTIT